MDRPSDPFDIFPERLDEFWGVAGIAINTPLATIVHNASPALLVTPPTPPPRQPYAQSDKFATLLDSNFPSNNPAEEKGVYRECSSLGGRANLNQKAIWLPSIDLCLTVHILVKSGVLLSDVRK